LKKATYFDGRTPSEFPEKKAGKGGKNTLVSENATKGAWEMREL
jgi:hypothetical protein